MARRQQDVIVEFANVGGGLNTTDDMMQIGNTQVQQCLNARLYKDGIFIRPGTEAGDAVLSTNGRGIFIYRKLDGTETILLMSNGKLYSTPTNLDSVTELYNLTGTGKAYFANYLDKCWVCNGTDVVKVESSTAYQVGISPPSGVAAAKAAGGSIPAGTYTVYACYARNVAGAPELYSVGENLGTVTLETTNLTIAITNFANSTDGQVGNKVIFLTEPAGATVFYYETNDNTTTSFNITSQATRDSDVIYSEVAEGNTRPTAFEYIYAFDGSIWGSNSNTLWKSIKSTSNVYDMERFTSNIVLPYDIKGIFELGEHLYLNTSGGIIRVPFGDMLSQWDKVTKDYFYDINTVVEIPNKGILGVTYQGVYIFDGEKFLTHDIAGDIKPEIKKIYGTTSGFSPFGFLIRTDKRLEYHLGYNDDTLGTTSNNARLVLNVDKIQLLPNAEVIAPWEIWSCGFNYGAVSLGQVQYLLQDHTTPKLYKLNFNNSYDEGTYLNNGSLGTATTKVGLTTTTRAYMANSFTMIRWKLIRLIANINGTLNIELNIRENTSGLTDEQSITPTGGAVWGPADDNVFTWDVSNWGTEDLLFASTKTKDDTKGYIMYIKITYEANDVNSHIKSLQVQGEPTHDYSTEMP